MMWTRKHEPKKTSELIVSPETIKRFESFIKNYSKEKKRAILLWGPTGIGKTLLATVFAKENDYEIIELNASSQRSKKIIESTLKNTVLSGSIFGKQKIILIDEIDCTSRKDYGLIPAVIEIIKTTRHPIILTATDYWDSSISSLRKHVLGVEVKPSSTEHRISHLKKILSSTGFEEEALKKLLEKNENDFRGLLNDAQSIHYAGGITLENLKQTTGRTRKSDLKEAVHKTLTAQSMEESYKELMNTDAQPREILEWISENMHNYNAKLEKFMLLSQADIFNARIMRRQYWRLLYYQTILLAGINGLQGSVKYPELFKKLFITRSKRAKREGITKKLGEQLHASKRKIAEYYLPLLRKMSKKELEELELEKEEINYLKN